jgi:hypothetical protein
MNAVVESGVDGKLTFLRSPLSAMACLANNQQDKSRWGRRRFSTHDELRRFWGAPRSVVAKLHSTAW